MSLSFSSFRFLVSPFLYNQRGPLKNPSLIGKQGKLSQLGGDFIFGPGNTCSFASRMRHTEDRESSLLNGINSCFR